MASVAIAMMPPAVDAERMANVAAIFRRNSPRDDGTIDRSDLRIVLESLRCEHLGDDELEALLPISASGVADSIQVEPWLRWLFESDGRSSPKGGSGKMAGACGRIESATHGTPAEQQAELSEAPAAAPQEVRFEATAGTSAQVAPPEAAAAPSPGAQRRRPLLRASTCCALEASAFVAAASVQVRGVRGCRGGVVAEFDVPAVVNVVSMKEGVAKATGLAISKQRLFLGKTELAGIWRPQPEAAVVLLTLVELDDLEAACMALDRLTANDVRELEMMRKPPHSVMITMAAVMTALHRPPTWAEAKVFLGDADHMKDKLKHIDHHSLCSEQLGKLHRLCAMPEFRPEAISGVSRAAGTLCLWIRTVVAYADARGS